MGSMTGPQKCFLEIACSKGPVVVSGVSGVKAIASGVWSNRALAQLTDQTFVTWGVGCLGGLGDGVRESSATPIHVCAPFAIGSCPTGPYLTGEATAMAVGENHDLVSLASELGP
jgi:hypothetical protein